MSWSPGNPLDPPTKSRDDGGGSVEDKEKHPDKVGERLLSVREVLKGRQRVPD